MSGGFVSHKRKTIGRILLILAGTILTVRLLGRGASSGTRSQSMFSQVLVALFSCVNRYISWHHLPPWLGAMNVLAFRYVLRQQNLHDTSGQTLVTASATVKCDPHALYNRISEGTCNDLQLPAMGAAGQRFGRNVPLRYTFPEKEPALLTPSPRVVSRRLLTRETFLPADTLNLLAAALIQFQNHDLFAHLNSAKGSQ